MHTTRILLLATLLTSAAYSQKSAFTLKYSGGSIGLNKFSGLYYCSFILNKPAAFILESKFRISSAEISPRNAGLFPGLDGQRMNFDLSRPGKYVLRLNDTVKIFLFAEKPDLQELKDTVNIITGYKVDNTGKTNQTENIQRAISEISGTGRTLFFPPGVYRSGQLRLKSNTAIFLSEGAVLEADTASVSSFMPDDEMENRRFIYIRDAENVTITGRGTIDGNGTRLRNRYGDNARIRLLLAVRSKNIKIEGIMLKDPGSWNIQVIMCENVVFRNIKLINNTGLSNTDGFDPDASRNILIEDCFASCGDDNVAIKTTGKSGLVGDVSDITVRGCLFLTRKSSLKVGTETRAAVMKNIVFEDNDVLECDRGMAIYVLDGAALDNVIFRNNRFDRNYPDAQRKGIHFQVDKREPESKLGTVKNVLIKDCIFYNRFPKKSEISFNGDYKGIDVTIDNLVIEGSKAFSLETAAIQTKNAKVTLR
jgi:polygalacturonase